MSSLNIDKPHDFDSFWKAALDELARIPPAPEIEEMPLRSTDFATAYTVRLTSIGPYRIFAYLSIPRGEGPFPARYYLPRYGSVVELIPQGTANALRRQYVTFTIGFRGLRGADQPFAASFPGLLTQDITDLESYIYRGIIADCCCGLEYLLKRPEVDSNQVVALGNDLALVTAALRPQVTHVVCAPALFYATGDLATRTSAYPLEEINDYLRYYPSEREAVLRTLSYFDLRWFAAQLKATTLIMGNADGELLDHETLKPLLEAFPEHVELHKAEHSTYKDGLFAEEWVTQQLGLGKAILPEHWQ